MQKRKLMTKGTTNVAKQASLALLLTEQLVFDSGQLYGK